jgi:hypothetical protein
MYTIQRKIMATLGTQGTRQKKNKNKHTKKTPKKPHSTICVEEYYAQASTTHVNKPSYKQLGVQRNITS